MVGELSVAGCFLNQGIGVGIHPPCCILQVDIHVKVPLFKKVHHAGRQFLQAGMRPDEDGAIFISTGPVGGPAFVGVSRFFQPHQVQQQGRVVGSPLGTQPGISILVSAKKGLVQGSLSAGVLPDDMDVAVSFLVNWSVKPYPSICCRFTSSQFQPTGQDTRRAFPMLSAVEKRLLYCCCFRSSTWSSAGYCS